MASSLKALALNAFALALPPKTWPCTVWWIMELSLSRTFTPVSESVTELLLSEEKMSRNFRRLCRDSWLWWLHSLWISRQHYGALSLQSSRTSHLKAAHSITVRQFGTKCRRWDFKQTRWWNGACSNSFGIPTHSSSELAVLDNWKEIINLIALHQTREIYQS